MIKQAVGNIMDAKEGIICHQVNTRAVIGGGLALQIRNKYPNTYKRYVSFCSRHKSSELLGKVLFTQENKLIANIFGQNDYGCNKQQTDYEALEKGLNSVKCVASGEDNHLYTYSVAIPYSIGCGLGGGDWNIVYKIIEKVFNNVDFDVVIYKLQ